MGKRHRDRPAAAALAGPAALQAVVFVVSGLWPLVHYRSFVAITGPKADDWLVKTVGLLIAVIGGALGLAARRQRVTRELAALGVAASGALAAVDVYYVGRGRISRVYLLDALLEFSFILWWALALAASRAARGKATPVGETAGPAGQDTA